MKKHTRIYLDAMGYDECEWLECEIPGCHKKLIDLHHIECRGMGGRKGKDVIENLIGLCREHHVALGDRKEYKEYLKEVHKSKMIERNVLQHNP